MFSAFGRDLVGAALRAGLRRMFLLGTRDQPWMRQCEAALLAGGIESRWAQTGDGLALLLDVPTTDVEQAADILSALMGEELHRPRRPPLPVGAIALQPAFAVAAGAGALLLTFFWVTGPFDPANPWFRSGALLAGEVWRGEWWRLVTAATLHVDAGHAVGNTLFMVVLGWAVSERLGGGVMLLLALLAAIAGFLASLFLADAHATMGASGGLFGLLGVAAGHGVRGPPEPLGRRRHILRVVGAAVMLLAFTAFSAKANIHAHLGGFAFGFALGLVAPRRAPPLVVQIGAALVVAGVVAGAWRLAAP